MRKLSGDRSGRLGGRTAFLSASVPTRPGFRRVADAAFEIEQAVVAFVRAVLAEQGRLVFGGHPSISPLVASVAAEYLPPRLDAEGSRIAIYQSRAYEAVLPDKTWEMHRFGYAEIRWIDAVDGERFDPDRPGTQCPHSLARMREAMLAETEPDVMMAIGGMNGVVAEAELFEGFSRRDPTGRPKPIYLVERTGGAAERLAAASREQPERAAFHRLEEEWAAAVGMAPPVRPEEAPFAPYPVMMQWLVEQLARA